MRSGQTAFRPFASFAFGMALTGATTSALAQYRLQIDPPPSWTAGWTQASDTGGKDWRLVVYIPSDAVEGKPADLVSITTTISNGSKDDGVKRLVEAWALQLRKTCKTLSAVPADELIGEKFNVGYAQFYCPRRTDTRAGAVDAVKVIAADNEAHLIAVSHAAPPFKTLAPLAPWVKQANEYLQSVRLCTGPSPLKQECSP
jgi:hypothetical protein